MDTNTPAAAAAIKASGIAEADVLKIHDTPAGVAIITAAGHAIVDPGDAHPVAVQRGVPCNWQPRGEPSPEQARGRG